jgi:hypothetical protein
LETSFPNLFETKDLEDEEESNNGGREGTSQKVDVRYGLILYYLTFVKISRINFNETLEQPIGLVFNLLSVEVERVKRENEQIRKMTKH